MSRTVDEKVVELRFDNSQFESGAKTSLSTLERLKQGLNFDSAQKSVGGISRLFAKMNLGSVGDAIETVGSKFTTMGIMATAAIQNITNRLVNMSLKLATAVPHQIIQGGIKRAFNIENAHFMLQGLLKDEAAVQAVMDKASKSVDGTAYSYDSAAKAAAQFTASGMKAEQLVGPLRAITGVAAMTNAEYEDISRIFTTVAGNGRLMGDQLLQLSGRGLNAASTIADYFNKVKDGSIEATDEVKSAINSISSGSKTTEADIRDLVSKGKINFELFSAAMDDAFGEHAQKANETFTGALSNIKAALSRIGAEFVSPLIKQNGPLVKMFNSIRIAINAIKADIKPFANMFVKVVSSISNGIAGITKTVTGPDGKKSTELLLDIHTLMEGLLHLTSPLQQGFSAIKKAFKAIFPPVTIDTINGVISKFEQFTKSIANIGTGFGHFTKLVSIFKGFFAILDIGKQILSAVFNNLKLLVGPVSELSSGIFDSAASFGEWLTALSKSLRESDFFNKKIQEMITWVQNLIAKIQDLIVKAKALWEAFKGKFEEVSGIDLHIPTWEEFKDILESIKEKCKPLIDWFGKLKDVLNDLAKDIGKLINFENLLKIFTKLGEILGNIGAFIGKAAGKIQQVFAGLGATISDFFKNLSTEEAQGIGKGIFDAGVLGGLLVLVKEFVSTLDTFKSAASNVGGFFGSIKGTLDSVKSTLQAYQESLEARKIKEIAIAIGILAVSVLILSSISAEQAAVGIATLSNIMGIMFGFMALYSKFIASVDPKQSLMQAQMFSMVGTAMLKMAAGILILALAMKVLDSVSWQGVAKGLVTMAVALGALMFATIGIQQLGGPQALKRLGSAMVALGFAMILLAASMLIFDQVSWQGLAKGLAAMAVALGALMGAAIGISKLGSNGALLSLSVALIALGNAMLLLAASMLIFDRISWQGVAKGLVTMAVALGALMGVSIGIAKLGSSGALLALSVALIALANAMMIISVSMLIFNQVPWSGIAKGLVTLVAALAALTAVAVIISSTGSIGSLLALSLALGVLGGTMLAFAIAMKIFDSVSWSGVGKGLLVFAVALGALVAVAALFGPLVPAMLGVAAAMLLLSVSVAVLGVGLLAIAAAFNLFVTTLMILAGVSATTAAAIVTAMQIIVMGIITMLPAIAAAITNFFVILISSIATSIQAITDALKVILVAILDLFIALLPKLGELLAAIIVMICEIIIGSAPKIGEAIKAVLLATLDVLNEVIPELTDTLFQILVALYEQCVEYIPQIVTLFINLIIGILNAITEKIDDIVNAAYDIIIAFMDAIGEKIPEVVESGIQMVLNLVNGIADAIEDHTEEMQQAIERLITAMLDMGIAVISGMINPFLKKGEELMNSGFMQGLKNILKSLWNVIKVPIEKAVNAIKGFVSRFRSVGESIMNSGFVQGIKNKITQVKTLITSKISEAVSAIRNFVGRFRDVGSNIMNGLAGGISGALNAVLSKITGVGNAVLSKIKALLGIHSPSTEFEWIGEMAMLGFANGIKSMTNTVAKESENVGKTAMDEMGESLRDMDVYFRDMNFDPTIRPVVDLSSVKQASEELAGIFNDPILSATAADASAALSNRGSISDYAAATESGNKKLLEAMNSQSEALNKLYERVDGMQIRLDSGELVGGIVEKMDNAFGTRTMYQMRSN